MTRARVRGIYATALTERLREAGLTVVDPSEPIRRRFDADFGTGPPGVSVETTDDRQGIGLSGESDAVARAAGAADVARDALAWRDPAPADAVFVADVVDTAGAGAVLDLGEREGYLPFEAVDDYVETGDRLRVAVDEARPPWVDDRPELRTDLRVGGSVLSLVRGQSRTTADVPGDRATELARTLELLSADPPDGWGVHFEYPAADAGMETLDAALAAASDRAGDLTAALAADPADLSGDPTDVGGDPAGSVPTDGGSAGDDAADGAAGDPAVPRRVAAPRAGRWVWFGRESRFALDAERRAVVATMPGHHRLKAGHPAASTAVDFVEDVCAGALGGSGPASGDGAGDGEDDGDREIGGDDGPAFPFGAALRAFGPAEGDRVRIAHGKPDGRLFDLGRAEVTAAEADGTVTLEREIRGAGEYDGLGTPRERGDVATTRVVEGRWWYPTVYRGADGAKKGTYVNVCTPVEVFPDAVRYVDLHVDVVRRPDGEVERVDDDELDAALERGDLGEDLAEKARAVAATLENAL